MSDPRHLKGLRAEEATAAWLESCGWSVLARRWRCAAGELDLVALDAAGALVAVEVKLRSSARVGDPLESVDQRRLLRLRRALSQFAAQLRQGGGGAARIDLVVARPQVPGRWRLTRYSGIDAW